MYYRHEYKYIIHEGDRLALCSRLAPVLRRDRHADDRGGYHVRSLYFDDIYGSAIQNKVEGHAEREKYRIRFYNGSADAVRLERKEKNGGLIHKDGAALDPNELQQLLAGEAGALLHSEKPLLRRWATAARTQLLRPVQLVDYRRRVFTLPEGNVRVTLDSRLRAPLRVDRDSLFAGGEPSLPALPAGISILEVKYDAYLPKGVRQLLQLRHREWQAASKYVLCCLAARHTKENYAYATLS